MNALRVADGVWWVGAMDWDRRLFDELIPLPDGTSYNAYLLQGSEKTALIDSVDPSKADVLLDRLERARVSRIDYIVSNHTEQDHSGTIPRLLEMHPEAKVLATDKARTMLADHIGIAEERVVGVKDGERLGLGGMSLEFIHFPWVHWPETMLTWVPERRILFSCDLFGSHLATGDLFADDEATVLMAAKRYYAEIMMPFTAAIEKRMPRVTALDIAMIAPSHGPIYREPKVILDAYAEWVSGPPKNLVVVPYVSMHGSTRRMVEHLVDACAHLGVRAEQVNLTDADLGKLAVLLVDAATIVLGTPAVLNGPHPKAAYAAILVNALKPKVRHLSVIGSYGWGAKTAEQVAALLSGLKAELLPPVLCKGLPKAADFAALDHLAGEIARRHQGL